MKQFIDTHWRSVLGLTAAVAALAALLALVNDGGGSFVLRDGTPVRVERGPLWLARLAYQPPPWLGVVIKALLVVLVGAVALGYNRHGIDEETIRDLSETGITMVSVLFVARWIAGIEAVPFWAGAVAGGVGGWLLGTAISRGFYRVFDGPDQERGQISPSPIARMAGILIAVAVTIQVLGAPSL